MPVQKTELCRSIQLNKPCPFGADCHFAHAISQLTIKPKPSSFKSEPCSRGKLCTYGRKCNFIHPGEDDAMLLAALAILSPDKRATTLLSTSIRRCSSLASNNDAVLPEESRLHRYANRRLVEAEWRTAGQPVSCEWRVRCRGVRRRVKVK